MLIWPFSSALNKMLIFVVLLSFGNMTEIYILPLAGATGLKSAIKVQDKIQEERRSCSLYRRFKVT